MGIANDMCAESSGLRTHQAKVSADVPEEPTPTPPLSHRADIPLLAEVLDEMSGLFVCRQ